MTLRGNCVVFSANRGYALTSSRRSLLVTFMSSGWRVVIATADDAESQELADLGAHVEEVAIRRGGLRLVGDFAAYRRLGQIYRKWQPTVVHHFHAKPAIFGTVAARRVMGRMVRVVNTITGLGHAFVAGGMSSRLAVAGYRLASARADATVFQNRHDQALFVKQGWIKKERARLITGSGVDIDRFKLVDRTRRDVRNPTVVMLGRLLVQKGVPEFVETARRLRDRWPNAHFVLAGEEDPEHPDALSRDWIASQKAVEYVGRLSDVKPLLARADLLLFPSTYREGVPRVVMEAAATGLPTVAFDVPGVVEAVNDGETGYLVPARDIEALVTRVEELFVDVDLRVRMGHAARALAERAFDIRAIEAQYLALYRQLGVEIT